MKKRYLICLLCIAFGLSIFSSCENLDDLSELGLKPSILAPALRTEIDVYDFERLLTQSSEYVVANPLPPTTIQAPFPGADIPGKQKSTFLNIFDIANRIFLNETKATISFTNVFPTNLQPPTEFVLRDSANPQNIIFRETISREIAPGETYSFNIEGERDTVASTLEFYVANIRLASSNGELVSVSDEDFIVNLNVEVVEIEKVELKSNISYSDTAVQDFEINIDNPDDTAAYSGALSIFLTNKYPLEFRLKLDLLDDQSNLVFSVFGDSALVVDHAPLDNSGNAIGEVVAERINFLNLKEINNLDRVRKMRVDVTLTTPNDPDDPEFVIVDEQTSLDLLITADISVDPSKAK